MRRSDLRADVFRRDLGDLERARLEGELYSHEAWWCASSGAVRLSDMENRMMGIKALIRLYVK